MRWLVQKTQPSALSTLSLNAEGKQLLQKALSDMACDLTALTDTGERLGSLGLSLGAYSLTVPSGTVDDDHAVLLAYATPLVDLTDRQYSSVSVSVVVENGGENFKTDEIVRDIMEQYYLEP